MILNKTQCDSIYLHAVIKECYAALSVNPYLCYIFDPIPLVEGIRIQDGSLCMMPYALGISSWGTFG